MTKPSLALIPSGYKASKVYSILPNNGDGDFTFSRSSTATRVNKDGLIETVDSNIPRLDYTDGGCPILKLEPQRKNDVLYSEEFNSYWVKNACLTDDNYAISPSGELNACRLRDDNGGGAASVAIYKGFVFNTNTEYTFSCFAKKDQVDFISLRTSGFDGTANGNSFFNVANGTLGTIRPDHTAKIEDYGNGWYRCSITFSVTSGDVSGLLSIYANEQDIVLTSNRDNTTSVFIYGAQLEEGSYATSYIPTYGSTATRLADQCVNNDLDFIIQDEGSVYWEGAIQGETPILIQLSPDTGIFSNTIYIEYASSVNQLRMRVYSGGVLQSFFATTVQKNTIYKIALGYKENDIVGVVNGSIIGTDASALIQSGLSNVNIGELRGVTNDAYNGVTLKKALLYDKRLSNEELQELTTI